MLGQHISGTGYTQQRRSRSCLSARQLYWSRLCFSEAWMMEAIRLERPLVAKIAFKLQLSETIRQLDLHCLHQWNLQFYVLMDRAERRRKRGGNRKTEKGRHEGRCQRLELRKCFLCVTIFLAKPNSKMLLSQMHLPNWNKKQRGPSFTSLWPPCVAQKRSTETLNTLV